MTPARPALLPARATTFLVVLAVVVAGVIGTQLWPTVAAAAPSSSPSPSPSPSPSATPRPTPTSTSTPSPTPAPTQATSTAVPAAAAGPIAVADTVSAQADTEQLEVFYLRNDTAGAASLHPALTTFPAADQPAGGGKVRSDGSGVDFTFGSLFIYTGGRMLFRPVQGQTGTAVARYRLVDANGAAAEALVTVVIGPGGQNTAIDVLQTHTGSTDVLAGAVPSRNADGTLGSIDRSSLRFPTGGQPAGVTVSDSGRTLRFPGVGVFTADPTGVVTYQPVARFKGYEGVRFEAQDTTRTSDGTVVHHAFVLTVTAVVTAIYPHAVFDQGTTPFNTSDTLAGATNDEPGEPDIPLRPDLTVFSYDNQGKKFTPYDHGRGLKVSDEGWWTIASDGTITFTPVRGFVGSSFVYYTVEDVYGGTDTTSAQVFVLKGPSTARDTATTVQNVNVTTDVLKNDAPGWGADSQDGSIDRTYVRFPVTPQPDGAQVSGYSRILTVPGQGVYSADRVTGDITFDPDPGFTGKASPVTYSMRDTVHRTDGRVVHNPATSTLTASVTPITPVASDDVATTVFGTAVDIRPVANDHAGAASAPLVPSSVRLRLTTGLPSGSELSPDATVLTIAGRGQFVARADGTVTFTPAVGFTGQVPAAGYQVSDANGTPALASITVTVGGAAVMRPTRETMRAGETLVVDVLSNDDPPTGAGWDRSSVCLLVGGGCVKTASASGATWSVDAQGGIACTPASTGTTQISYSVHDTVVGTYTSTLTVVVAAAREARGD
ncbi:MAG TPA: cadherin-like domain-containing protein [Friedmanniella sp.]